MDVNRGTHNLPAMAEAALSRPAIVSRDFRGVKAENFRRHWVRNDPYDTAFFNALSAVFPHGEIFMIKAMIAWVDRLPEPLQSEARTFIEQEAGHSREHIGMNKGLIEAGYDIEPLDRKIRAFVAFFESASDMTKLTVTMCIEHFTAIIAAELLRNPEHLAGADPEVRELWQWHAIEEVEHKGVAYDVWLWGTRDWSGARRWLTRSGCMLAITASFFVNRTLGQIELLRQDGMGRWAAFRGIFRSGFRKGGIGRNVLSSWLDFFRPGFHPWDIDDRLLVAQGEAALATAKAKRAGYDGAEIALQMVPAERRKGSRNRKAA